MKHIFGCHFKIRWTNRNIILIFQSGQITEQPKTLNDLDGYNLKFFRYGPIRIKIITCSHIFILFLPHIGTLCLHFTPCYLLW